MRDAGHIITTSWPENYGRAWVDLLEDESLSEHARICYVAMTSFGRESRAGSKAIMRRMGVKSKTTLRAAQSELVVTGWMRCLEQATPTKPARWEMLAPKTKHLGGEGHHVTQGGSQNDPGEGHHVTPKQEDKHESKQEKTAAKAAASSKAQSIIKVFCESHTEAGLGTYKISGRDAGQAKLVPDFDESWFRPACRAYMADAWSRQNGLTLAGMLGSLNKWATKGQNLPKPPCKHAETEIIETRGTAQHHKCKSCGLSIWR